MNIETLPGLIRNLDPRADSPEHRTPLWRAVLTDRVVIALLLTLVAWFLIDATQALDGLAFAFRAFGGILPFLLLAVSVAALSRATGADRNVAAAFTGSPARSIILAALAGALSPFCSCGVVPVIASLLRAGVPLAPVMAFWIASPIMDPEMFILTAAGIGVSFTVAKTLAAVIMGLLSGYGIHLFRHTADLSAPLRGTGNGSCSTSLTSGPVVWRFWRSPERRRVFVSEVTSASLFLGKWLVLAFLLEGLMTAYLPPQWIAGSLGSGAWYEIPLASLAGIPAYLNGYAAIPLVKGLMDMGMNPGAAMAFMTAGAVSSIPAAMAVAVLVKRSVFVAYLGFGLVGSLLSGFAYFAIG